MADPKGIEVVIEAAIQRGDFDNLPGAGKPIDLSAYFATPEDLRLAYAILKNADMLPREAELLKEIASLKQELSTTASKTRQKELAGEIEKRLLQYNLLIEKNKHGRGR